MVQIVPLMCNLVITTTRGFLSHFSCAVAQLTGLLAWEGIRFDIILGLNKVLEDGRD